MLGFLVAVLVVGPYLRSGLRTEHIAVYGSLLFLLARGEVRLRGPVVPIIGAQTLLFLGVGVSTLTAPTGIRSSTGFSVIRSPLAGVDDLLLVMAAVVVGASLGSTKSGAASALSAVYKGVVSVCGFNLMLQITQVFGLGESVFAFFNRGLAPSASQIIRYSQDSAGAAVFSWDRFPGLFIQPFEGGIFYGVALIMWAFRWGLHRPYLQAIYGCIIVSGAALAGSKAALPAIGIILFATAFRWQALPKLRGAAIASISTISIALWSLLRWLDVDPLTRLRLEQYSALSAFTGGRYGSGLASSWVEEILKKSPFGGYGFAGYPLPADTMLLGWLSSGGIFAVFVWLSILTMVTYAAFRWRREVHNVGFAVCCYAILAGLGGPALSANRSSSLLWIVLSLSCLGAWRWPLTRRALHRDDDEAQ